VNRSAQASSRYKETKHTFAELLHRYKAKLGLWGRDGEGESKVIRLFFEKN
jgi:hypothetical protein